MKAVTNKKQLPSSTPLKQDIEIVKPEIVLPTVEVTTINHATIEEAPSVINETVNGCNKKIENFSEYISPLGSTTRFV